MRFPEPVRKINGIEVGGTADLSRVVPPIQETEGLGRVAIDGFTDSTESVSPHQISGLYPLPRKIQRVRGTPPPLIVRTLTYNANAPAP